MRKNPGKKPLGARKPFRRGTQARDKYTDPNGQRFIETKSGWKRIPQK